MLYGEFKKRFDHDEEYGETYRIDDTRADKSNKADKKPKKKRTALRVIIGVLCVIVCICSASLLYVDLFTTDGIAGLYATLFNKNKAEFYYALSQGSYTSLDAAQAEADGLKPSGCAGYIYYDGSYNVLVCLYPNKETAQRVSQETNYALFPIMKSSFAANTFPTALRTEARTALGFEHTLIDELYAIAAEMENKKMDSKTAAERIATAVNAAKQKTDGFMSAAEGSADPSVLKYKSAIISAYSALESLTNLQQVRPSYLSDLRHVTVFIATALSSC